MKVNIVLLALLALGLGLLWASRQQAEIRTEVFLPAPPAQVWQVLTDAARYPEWNPVIVQMEGALVEGGRIRFTNQGADGSHMTFQPRLLRVQRAQELRWRGQLWLPGLFDGEHYFVLTPDGDGTLLTHGERFQGVLVPVVRGWLNGDIRSNFERMNQALAQRVAEKR